MNFSVLCNHFVHLFSAILCTYHLLNTETFMPAHCLTSSSAGQCYLAGTKAGGFADEALECSLCLLVCFWLCKVLWPGASAPLDGSQTPHSGIPLGQHFCWALCGSRSVRGEMLGLPLGYTSVFMLELACWTELEELWSAAEPLPVVCLLLQSFTDQHRGGGPGALWGQVNQGSGQKQSTTAGGGWGEHAEVWGVMVLLWSDISLILCLVLPLIPTPPSCLHLAPLPGVMGAARALLTSPADFGLV